MKPNLLAAALFAFHAALSRAAPSPALPQLKLSIEVPGSAVAPTTNVLLVFAGNQPARFGNFYSVNATIDGAEFTIGMPNPHLLMCVMVFVHADDGVISQRIPSKSGPFRSIITVTAQ